MWNRQVSWIKPRARAFTLVELMIVVVIVAVLAMTAIPIYRSSVAKAQMSEGIAGVGTIRTSFRVYASVNNGEYPVLSGADGSGLSVLGVEEPALEGKYHSPDDYEADSSATTYTVRVTNPETGLVYEIDQDGTETTGDGYFTSGY